MDEQTNCHACRQVTDYKGYCRWCDEFSHQGKPLPPDPRDAVVDAARELMDWLDYDEHKNEEGACAAKLREALRGLGEG